MPQLDTNCPRCHSTESRLAATGNKRQCLRCGVTFQFRNQPASEEKLRSIHSNLRRSRSQELRGARALGGRRTLASGATKMEKSDVVTSARGERPTGVRMECKTTTKSSRALRLSELQKIASEAKGDEIPVLAVELTAASGRAEEFYVFPKAWALALLEAFYDRAADD